MTIDAISRSVDWDQWRAAAAGFQWQQPAANVVPGTPRTLVPASTVTENIMRTNTRLTALAVALAALTAAGCGMVSDKVSPDTLVAARVAKAPDPTALAADPAWASARPINVLLSGGRN